MRLPSFLLVIPVMALLSISADGATDPPTPPKQPSRMRSLGGKLRRSSGASQSKTLIPQPFVPSCQANIGVYTMVNGRGERHYVLLDKPLTVSFPITVLSLKQMIMEHHRAFAQLMTANSAFRFHEPFEVLNGTMWIVDRNKKEKKSIVTTKDDMIIQLNDELSQVFCGQAFVCFEVGEPPQYTILVHHDLLPKNPSCVVKLSVTRTIAEMMSDCVGIVNVKYKVALDVRRAFLYEYSNKYFLSEELEKPSTSRICRLSVISFPDAEETAIEVIAYAQGKPEPSMYECRAILERNKTYWTGDFKRLCDPQVPGMWVMGLFDEFSYNTPGSLPMTSYRPADNPEHKTLRVVAGMKVRTFVCMKPALYFVNSFPVQDLYFKPGMTLADAASKLPVNIGKLAQEARIFTRGQTVKDSSYSKLCKEEYISKTVDIEKDQPFSQLNKSEDVRLFLPCSDYEVIITRKYGSPIRLTVPNVSSKTTVAEVRQRLKDTTKIPTKPGAQLKFGETNWKSLKDTDTFADQRENINEKDWISIRQSTSDWFNRSLLHLQAND